MIYSSDIVIIYLYIVDTYIDIGIRHLKYEYRPSNRKGKRKRTKLQVGYVANILIVEGESEVVSICNEKEALPVDVRLVAFQDGTF